MQRSARDVLHQYWDWSGPRGENQPRLWPSTTRTGRARGAMDDPETSWSRGALRFWTLVRLILEKRGKAIPYVWRKVFSPALLWSLAARDSAFSPAESAALDLRRARQRPRAISRGADFSPYLPAALWDHEEMCRGENQM